MALLGFIAGLLVSWWLDSIGWERTAQVVAWVSVVLCFGTFLALTFLRGAFR